MISHWAEELASFAFVWLLYFGAIVATKKNGHFRITAQFQLLPEKYRKYARTLLEENKKINIIQSYVTEIKTKNKRVK